jgi:hypothetical protein
VLYRSTATQPDAIGLQISRDVVVSVSNHRGFVSITSLFLTSLFFSPVWFYHQAEWWAKGKEFRRYACWAGASRYSVGG